MILSASRRTDIPAFYGEWFINQYKKGIFYIKNPFNPSQIKYIDLKENKIECIVFWTKNAKPFFKYLKEVNVPFYFLYTITNYGKILEPNVPDIEESISTFKKLSLLIGKERIIWRYDPIIFIEYIDENWHIENFKYLINHLKNYTNKCIASFLYMYKKCVRNLSQFNINKKSENELKLFIQKIEEIAKINGFEINWCCVDKKILSKRSILSSCIDKKLIEKLTNLNFPHLKDKNQRALCNCYPSIDIGTYNTCIHGCKYCYANTNNNLANLNYNKHNPDYQFII